MIRLSTVILSVSMFLTLTGRVLAADQPPWGVKRIRANLVWNMDTGYGIRIAIIDTGIFYSHPELEGRVVDGTSFRGYYWGDDPQNHGTLVAGIIAAIMNGYGLVGVSPDACLLSVVLLPVPRNHENEIVDALYWAAASPPQGGGAQIIVMSFWMDQDYPAVHEACDDICNEGILLIGMAGNDGGPVRYPAAYDSVIAVGAVDENDNRASWSNCGDELELVAPGVNINSTSADWNVPPYQPYIVDSGTSFAVPHVAGVAALIYASKIDPEYDDNNNKVWDNSEVREKLQDTALDLGALGKDEYYGYGLVNAWYASQRPPGDINSDHCVNGKDAVILGKAFGSHPGDPNWDLRADINIDNNVNAKDSTIVGSNFGKIDP